MLESILRPVGTCTTEESPVDLPPARSLPFNTPVSKVNSFVPDAEKASTLLSDGFTCAWAGDNPCMPKAIASAVTATDHGFILMERLGWLATSDVSGHLPTR